MKGTKRVYAQRSASRPGPKRQTVRNQLMRLKETKRAVAFQTTDPSGANGNYTQLVGNYSTIEDRLDSDQGILTGMNVRITASSTGLDFVRVLILKDKRDATVSATSLLWLDYAQAQGQAATSTEVLAFEQMVYPINKDGFVVKYDRMFALTSSDNVVAEKFIKCNENIQIYDDSATHSANYFICCYGIKSDGTASTAIVNVGVELLFKDRV